MSVAAVRQPFGLLLVKMIIQFGVQYPLRKRLLQIVEQTVLGKQLLWVARPASNRFQKFLLDDSPFDHHGLTHKIPDIPNDGEPTTAIIAKSLVSMLKSAS
ncbi:hypothetical protein X742_35115 [Mesorhizobium sp. LNHC232B00]|nr:hypothetical protein X742_35115 [Mesorhizobium sp. LNHC232B00]